MFFDLALVYDPEVRRCDLMIGDDGDLAIDETPITAMLLSIGVDRRAAPDDPLPLGRSEFLTPAGFDERRGSAGDALDPFGQRAGSRTWLLDRAKATETTRLLYQFWLEEALAWAEAETGSPAAIEVWWAARETLRWRATVDDATLEQSRRFG